MDGIGLGQQSGAMPITLLESQVEGVAAMTPPECPWTQKLFSDGLNISGVVKHSYTCSGRVQIRNAVIGHALVSFLFSHFRPTICC